MQAILPAYEASTLRALLNVAVCLPAFVALTFSRPVRSRICGAERGWPGHDLSHVDACTQVFFHAESDEAKQKQKQRKQSAISGTHMLLWLPHFHDFCLTVGILGCGMKG